MSAGAKKMILFVWLLISIAALISLALGAWDYFESLKNQTIGSVLMQSDSDVAGPNRLFLEQYLSTLKKSVIYLIINIAVTIFALVNINDKYK